MGGDARERVPEGGDAYILSNILCDLDDATAVAVLKNCRAAMSSAAKLLVIDRVLPLEQAADGERAMERREVIGKVVIRP